MAFLLVGAGLCVPAQAGEVSEALQKYQMDLHKGAQFLREGQHARALARFKLAREARPEAAGAYYWIALTYSEMRNYELAASNAEKATITDRNLVEAWLLLGQSQMFLRQWDEARLNLEQAHRLDSNNPLILFNLGRCYFHGFDQKKAALRFFRDAMNVGAHSSVTNQNAVKLQAQMYLGECYLKQDMPEAAITNFLAVIKADPHQTEARFRLAMAYLAADRKAEATETLHQVVKLDDQHYEAHLQLGYLYLKFIPDEKSARFHLERFYTLAPRDHPWRAKVYDYYAQLAKKKRGGESGDDTTADIVPGGSRVTVPDPGIR